MSVAIAGRFIDRILEHTQAGRETIAAAKDRGYMTISEMEFLDDLEMSKLPICETAIQMAAERDGKYVRSHNLAPDPRRRKGLYVSNTGSNPSLYIYGGIGAREGGISADDVQVELSRLSPTATIEVHVHSDGGDFHDGVAIHNLLARWLGHVVGYVDGKAYSAGSLLLMACNEVVMSPGAKMMIHGVALSSNGSWEQADLERALKVVRETNAELVNLYLPRWKKSEAELKAALKAETYYSGHEACEVGLADRVSSTSKVAPYSVVQGYRSKEFSLAASAGPHKMFFTRSATLRLWELAADDMRRECGIC